jgi:Tfp pilus tip-associated adhesin PilY1
VAGIGQGQRPVVDTFYHSGRNDRLAPILSKPEIAFAGDSNANGFQDLWVAFGTGRYQLQSDRWSREQQYLYALFDREGRSTNPQNPESAPYRAGDLVELTSNLVSGYILDRNGGPKDLNGDGLIGAEDLRVFRTISCAAPGGGGRCNPAGLAWRLALATGSGPSERVLIKPLAVAGILFATTFIPDADPCRGGGETWLFAMELDSGRPVPLALFDINRDGSIDQTDNNIVDQQGRRQLVGGYLVGRGRPTSLTLHGDRLIIATARAVGEAQGDQAVLQTVNEVKIPGLRAKFQAWRQVFTE